VIGIALLNLAMVGVDRARVDAVRDLLREVLAITLETASRAAGQSLVEVSAALAALRGDWARAARYYGIAERLTRDSGMQRDPSDDAFLRLHIARARSALSAEAFAAAEAMDAGGGYDEALADVAAWLRAQH
jgi:hypothetical protein